jgi:hypothetical protein
VSGATTSRAKTRELIGRTIVDVEWRPFRAQPGTADRTVAYQPVLTLDNGARVYFRTQETDVGEYGTLISATRPLWPDRPVRRRKKGTEDGHQDV